MGVLKVSGSGYYKLVNSGYPSPGDKDAVTLAVIRKIKRDNDGNYGVRRVHRLRAKLGAEMEKHVMIPLSILERTIALLDGWDVSACSYDSRYDHDSVLWEL